MASPRRETVPDRALEERLDEAVEETFPASDPIAVSREPRRRDPDDAPTPAG